MVRPEDVTLTVRLLKLGGSSIAVPLKGEAARKCGFLAGSFVRVIVLENEIRVRKATLPRLEDNETYEQYQERITREELAAERIREQDGDERA